MRGGRCCRRLSRLARRFRDQTYSEDRLSGLVEQLHLPLTVLLEFSGNAADDIAADAGQLLPGRVTVGKLGAVIARSGVAAILDAKEIERHGMKPMREGCSGRV